MARLRNIDLTGTSAIPVGSIEPYGGAAAPNGWLLCDGTAVSRTTYADLYAIIHTTFGAGDGLNTFNLPDLRQKFPLGKAAAGTGSVLGTSGGSIDHSHTVPAHYHALGTGADLAVGSSGGHSTALDHNHGSLTSDAGSSHTHAHTLGTAQGTAHSHVIQHTTATVVNGLDSYTVTNVVTDQAYNANATTLDEISDVLGTVITDLKNSEGSATLLGNDGSQDISTNTESSHTHGITGSISNESSHTHGVSIANYTGTSSSGGTHSHATGSMSGRIGIVTGGVDGNTSMTSGATNPPFLVVNYIIKY